MLIIQCMSFSSFGSFFLLKSVNLYGFVQSSAEVCLCGSSPFPHFASAFLACVRVRLHTAHPLHVCVPFMHAAFWYLSARAADCYDQWERAAACCLFSRADMSPAQHTRARWPRPRWPDHQFALLFVSCFRWALRLKQHTLRFIFFAASLLLQPRQPRCQYLEALMDFRLEVKVEASWMLSAVCIFHTCAACWCFSWGLSWEGVGKRGGGRGWRVATVEDAWWAASGESWWTGSGRDAACPLVSEDWVEEKWWEGGVAVEKRGHVDPLLVLHPSGVPHPGPKSLTADMRTERAGRLYQNICVVFPYLCTQSRYIIESPRPELQPVKQTQTHGNWDWPCRVLLLSLLSAEVSLLNSHRVTCLAAKALG